MKKCLNEGTVKIEQKNKEMFKVGEKEFLYAIDLIHEDIENKYKNKKIGLLGISRGGLPLLIAISYRTNIRKVDIIQIDQIEKDDNNKEAYILNDTISDDIEEYIVFENKRINNKIKKEIDLKEVILLDLYKKIEKRGFLVYYKNKELKDYSFIVKLEMR